MKQLASKFSLNMLLLAALLAFGTVVAVGCGDDSGGDKVDTDAGSGGKPDIDSGSGSGGKPGTGGAPGTGGKPGTGGAPGTGGTGGGGGDDAGAEDAG